MHSFDFSFNIKCEKNLYLYKQLLSYVKYIDMLKILFKRYLISCLLLLKLRLFFCCYTRKWFILEFQPFVIGFTCLGPIALLAFDHSKHLIDFIIMIKKLFLCKVSFWFPIKRTLTEYSVAIQILSNIPYQKTDFVGRTKSGHSYASYYEALIRLCFEYICCAY